MMHPVIKSAGQFVIDRAQHAYVVAASAAGLIDFPVPPNSNMRRTSSSWISHYYQSGINTGLPITTACKLYGLDLDAGTRVLDFGAGVGRQVRFFRKEFPKLNLWACDVEKSHIDWLASAYPEVDSYTNGYLPPLKYDDSSLDLVYSVSIFSHISEEHALLWLEEFARIVCSGGLLCLTTLGMTANGVIMFNERQSLIDRRDAALRTDGHYHEAYISTASHFDQSYGRTFYTADYIRARWPSAAWSIVGVAEGIVDGLQDLIVLRRS